jgi:hypothetical protein
MPDVLVAATRLHGCYALIGQPDEIVPGARVTVLSPSGTRQRRVVGKIATTLQDGRVVAWPADQVRWVRVDDQWMLSGSGLVPGVQVEVTSGSGSKTVTVGSIIDDSDPDNMLAVPAARPSIQPGVLYIRDDGIVVRRSVGDNGRMRDENLNSRSGRWERAALAFNAPYRPLTSEAASEWVERHRRCPRCCRRAESASSHQACLRRLPSERTPVSR